MSISEPAKIPRPFAETGIKNPIPPAANNTTGKAGFDKGFPERTMLPKASGGIPPSGMDFNGILYDITSAIRYMQAGGRPTYDAAFASAIGGYPSGAVLIGDDGASVFQNAVSGNETNPNSGGAGWTRPDLQVMELYRRSYAEAGYNVVGTFRDGFTIVNANDIGIDEATGKGFTGPAGNVPAGTDPTSGGFVDVSSLLPGAGVVRQGRFALRDYVSVIDFGAQGGGVFDDTTAFIAAGATNKPALVPLHIVRLTSDVAGQFYSYAPVKISGTGYANISLLTLGDVRPSTDVTGEIEVFAHRGFAGQAPQNTMLAFSTAISRGADGLEMDLQFSSDGVLYVFHDTTVDVLTNGTGAFTTLTSAAIDGLTFDSTVGTTFADESIPRFEEVLKLARRAGVKISVEMKNVWSPAQMTILLNLLEQYGYNNRHCTVSAGYIVYCEDFRVLSPSVGISYIHAGSFAATVPFIDRLKVISGELTINYTDALAEPNIVTYAYSKGVDVSAWTITSAEQAKSLVDIGIRKIVSDISFGGTV